MNLSGKRIVVTGAFGTVGAAVVKYALEAGAKVAAIDYADKAPSDQWNGEVFSLGGVDLSSPEKAEAAFATASGKLGGIDGLANIAGGFRWETVTDGSIDTWEAMFKINVRTAVVATKSALPYLLKSSTSAIVNVSAMGALKADMGLGAYAASKAGVAKLTEALAIEQKANGLRVNAVLPSIIDTAPNRADMPDADYSAWVSPQELSNVVLFLLSDAASAVTGGLVPVTGRV